MRTTIDLAPDVDARLRAMAREQGVPLRVVIDEALRAGLSAPQGGAGTHYVLPTRRLGVRPGLDLKKALALAGELEDEEIVRKLKLPK